HTRSKRDWSSDVCSSDLIVREKVPFWEVLEDSPNIFLWQIHQDWRSPRVQQRRESCWFSRDCKGSTRVDAEGQEQDSCVGGRSRSEEHTSELQSRFDLVC